MQAKHEVEINGVTYESQPEEIRVSCEGCDSEFDGKLCMQLNAPAHSCHGIIWIKKETNMQPQEQQAQPEVTTAEEPKYTVEEVLEAVEEVVDEYFAESQIKWIKDFLAKKNNPDYKLYLELKAKFGE